MAKTLPVLMLKGLIILPNQDIRLELNNDLSNDIINLSLTDFDGEVLIAYPKDQYEIDPDVTDLPNIAVIAKIKNKLTLPNGNVRLTILGKQRIGIQKYKSYEHNKDILMADTVELVSPLIKEVESEALRRKLLELIKELINVNPNMSNSILNIIKNIKDLDKFTDVIAAFMFYETDKKVNFMEEINPITRAEKLIKEINVEIKINKLEEDIDLSLQEEFDKNQRDYILKEKLESIKRELGEEDSKDDEIESYTNKINALDIDIKTKNKLLKEVKKFANMQDNSPELSMLKNYLDLVVNLPWNKESKTEEDLTKIKKRLDTTHYGLEKVKQRILEYVAVHKRNPEIKSPIICLVGPPGVGKTSLAISIASSLKREFYKISVGGLADSAELLGHRRTYLGSNPGKIIQAISKCEVNNPLILIDEVDKMVKDYKGDPASALLEILDPEQNNLFTDNFVEEPFSLHNVLFILTANNEYDIPPALYDRLEVINLHSYTEIEKIDIAKKYLIPTIYKEHKITKKDLVIPDDVIKEIINNYTIEAGVRSLSRCLTNIVRKVILNNDINDNHKVIKVTINDLKTYLGNPLIYPNKVLSITPGLVNGLAVSSIGGTTLPLEAVYYEGKGNIIMTGSLGEVMQESISVAKSYIISHKDMLKINDYYFQSKDIHLHAPEGATPKDGPSAGIAITTSLISLILKKQVPKDIAMTGEMTLRGDVLPIGGVKEKLIGAINNDIKKVYIPKDNERDLEDIPKEIKDKLDIVLISNYEEIYEELFSN